MKNESAYNNTSTGRNDSYCFNLVPIDVPKIDTKYRKIVTPIPPENSISRKKQKIFKYLIKMEIVGLISLLVLLLLTQGIDIQKSVMQYLKL